MGFSTYLLILGCISVINAQVQLPNFCARVFCLRVDCLKPVIPPGQCCAICPAQKKPGRCPQVPAGRPPRRSSLCGEICNSDYNCPGSQKCCSNGCGHSCMQPESGGWPNCAHAICPQLRCVNKYTPQRRCCPVCRPPGNTGCRNVQCTAVYCEGQYTPRGKCCPICPPTRY